MKKVKVVFEVDKKTLSEIISSGSKGGKRLSVKELDEIAKKDLIYAGDYLSAESQDLAVGSISKVITKTAKIVVDKASNKTVQRVAITEVVDKTASFVMSKDVIKGKVQKPKK